MSIRKMTLMMARHAKPTTRKAVWMPDEEEPVG
jgi:hypothetical protein